MPAWKEASVRSEGLKKTRARTFAGERRRLRMRLQPRGERQQIEHLLAGQVRQIDETLHGRIFPSAVDQGVDVLVLEDERRQQAHDVRIAAGAGEDAALEQLRLDLLGRPRGAQPEQEACALHVG